MKKIDSEALARGKKVKTIVIRNVGDTERGVPKMVFYYAMLSLDPKTKVAKLEVDNTHPLSDDEVETFNKENKE